MLKPKVEALGAHAGQRLKLEVQDRYRDRRRRDLLLMAATRLGVWSRCGTEMGNRWATT
jgi:hypothetical protein